MKVNLDRLTAKGKLFFMIEETWQGMEPTATYEAQAAALQRAMDSVEYIERAFDQGIVVLAHKASDRASTIQMVAVDNLEQLNDYIKTNEAHARLRPEHRRVIPLADWNAGRDSFEKMITRAKIRADVEKQGKSQPNQVDLEKLADERIKANRNK